MSNSLALAATASVLMMSAFALFSEGAAREPLGSDSMADVRSVSVPSLPEPALPRIFPR